MGYRGPPFLKEITKFGKKRIRYASTVTYCIIEVIINNVDMTGHIVFF